MRVALVGVAVVGCGSPTRTEAPLPARAAPAIALDAGRAASTLVATSSRRTRIEAPHGGTIAALAITHDGRSVLSEDTLGGIRLWPALDGSLEPRVVDLPASRALAIGPDARGFVVGMLDDSGGVGVAVVDRDGIVLQRAAIAGDPPYVAIAMSSHGLVALRSDQELHRIADDGAIVGRLVSDPGVRVTGLAVSGARAIAQLEGSGTPHARWIELPALAWGATVTVPAGELSLSPSGKRLLVVARASGQVAVLDASSGAVLGQDTIAGSAFALVDDQSLAILNSTLEIRPVTRMQGKPSAPRTALPLPVTPAMRSVFAIGGGRAIFAVQAELALGAPGQPVQYLGYELVAGHLASTAPGGLAFAHGARAVQLDAQLAATPLELALPAQHASIAALRWLGGSQWLVEAVGNDGAISIDVVDTATKRRSSVARALPSTHVLAYEPSTRLATISLGQGIDAVLRFDPAKGTMTTIAKVKRGSTYERASLVPVAPALANGAQLVVVRMDEQLSVRWLRDPSRLDAGPATRLGGSLAAVDAAGRVHVWEPSQDPRNRLTIATYRDGARVGELPTDEVRRLWPDRAGNRLAQASQRVLALVDRASGKRLWAKTAQGVVEVLWLDDGSVGVVSLGGVARLDAATGDVLAARCGWRLALSTTPKQPATPFAPLCTQLR